jgi:putative inorganic carbon (hco3(-)) transporter
VTVAAEQGLIGLAAYLGVVGAALFALFGDRAFARARAHGGEGDMRVARAALAAMFVALLVHTMVYAAFLEDPFTWVILAAGAALAPFAKLNEARVRAPSPRPEPVPAAG